MAPDMFHEAYWALAARYRRRLTIQFISDEPHLPWELMRPSSDDDSVVHQPLALQHIVARWIDRYRGDMRNSVPAGSLVSVAPKYASARLALPRAQEEQKQVVQKLGATALAGTRDDLLRLLENGKPLPPVAVLHFAGHGAFSSDVAAASSIKLENGMTLTAVEVKRKEVLLGRACRTLVFFNACEVGATGSVFGEVGGWADAFLERRFGGFIAPLWAVEEDDSAQVAAELLDSIYAHHVPIGEALRAIRNKYADKSPTFYSYLYYGDVTARIAK
jgi:CHAT domain-containing protein